MTNTLPTKNGLAQDALRMFTITDRTHKSSVTYLLEKFIGDCKFNIGGTDGTGGKLGKIEDLRQQKLDIFIEHKEHGVVLDNDRILQIDRDIEWQQTQMEVAQIMQAYLTQARDQLVPDEVEKSKSVAASIAELEKQYKQLQKSA